MRSKQQANKLLEQADRLKAFSKNRFPEEFQRLGQAWKGESDVCYIRKGEEISRKTSTLERELRKTAEVIRSSAERTYHAELLIRELAKKRIY